MANIEKINFIFKKAGKRNGVGKKEERLIAAEFFGFSGRLKWEDGGFCLVLGANLIYKCGCLRKRK